jgi:hypothetical protein
MTSSVTSLEGKIATMKQEYDHTVSSLRKAQADELLLL